MKQKARLLAVLLSIVMLVSMVGCANDSADTGSTDPVGNTGTTASTTTGGDTAGGQESTGGEEPQAAPDELSYWMAIDVSKVAPIYTNWGDSPMFGWIQEATNTKIEFIHPPAGQEAEKFNLMIASGDYADIIERDFGNTSYYPGGADKAIEDGVIIALNEAIDNGWCPNLMAYFDEHPEWVSNWVTDSGNYTNFPFIREDDLLLTFYGPLMRMDWVEEMNLGFDENNLPETIEDWNTILYAMQENGYAEHPLLITGLDYWSPGGFITGAYGVGWEWYVDEAGVMQYGPAQDGFREFLQQAHQWNKDGIVDPDWIASINTEQTRSRVMSGKSGIFFGMTVGGIGYYYDTINGSSGVNTAPNSPEDFHLVGIPYLKTEKGTTGRFGSTSLNVASNCAFISTSCENVQAACRLLDFGYSDEGWTIYNFGKEGVNFDYINYSEFASPVDLSHYGDQFPRWNDEVYNNPTHVQSIAMSQFVRSHIAGPFPQDEAYLVQTLVYDDQLLAIETWNNSTDYTGSLMPRMYYTAEESTTLAELESDLKTYKNETITKFITGDIELNDANWQEFQEGLIQMNLEEVLAVRRASHQRAINR